MLIDGHVVRTCGIYRIQITASLSDEDDVYLIESVVGGLHICIYGSSDLTAYVHSHQQLFATLLTL